MKNTLRRFAALLLAVVMTLALGMSAMAAEGDKPTASDTFKVAISDIESDMTVTAYRIVQPVYNDYGFVKYVVATEKKSGDVNDTDNKPVVSIASDDLVPTYSELETIAKDQTTLGKLLSQSLTYNKDTKNFEANLQAGYWIVLASTKSTSVKLYNPILVGVYYSVSGSDNTLTQNPGPVSANEKWELKGEVGKPKSQEPSVEKEIVDPESGNDKGDDTAAGDEIKFKIETTIPDYAENYTNPQVWVKDTKDSGIVYKADTLKVYYVTEDGTEEIPAKKDGKTNWTVEGFNKDSNTFTVKFTPDFVKENGGKDIRITYSASLDKTVFIVDDTVEPNIITDQAGNQVNLNGKANENTAVVNFTNNPTDGADATPGGTTPESKTFSYTFGIDANFNGPAGDNDKTKELTKTGAEEAEAEDAETENQPLAGAIFELYKDANHVYRAKSDDNGHLEFTGLDAGSYTLKEIKAPAGYAINENVISVVISAEYFGTDVKN
ncbi:MAG: isopeptide-forming domain-containing fimbrial protein, partial [Oscillospiraceae bacterium]|nr:isopeptide-forming domain-containing fimbrial protein [Oscillospiraceae bacterium]